MRKSFTPTTDPSSNASFSSASVAGSIQDDNMSDQCGLTQAGLEEYNSRSYYDQPVFHHQKQSSYAQSEGYHSYVSSSDSSSATPFLDRLRQESDLLSRQSSHRWSQSDLSASSNTLSTLNTTGLNNHSHNNHNNLNCNNNNSSCNIENNSSESTSSTETLKWLGSMSDVSVVSHSTSTSGISSSVSTSQLIVHSSKVRTPKRHHSESVLYMHDENQQQSQQYDIDQLHQLEHKAVNSISSNNISPNNYNNLSNSKSICSANNLSNKINENSNLNKSAPLLTNSNNCGLSTTQQLQHNNQIFNNHQQHSYHNQNNQHQSMVLMQQKQQQQQQQQQHQQQLQLHHQHQLKLMQTSGIPQVSSPHIKGNVTAITATTKILSSNNQMISSSTTLQHCNSVSTSNSCNSIKNNSINSSNQLLNDTNNSNNKTTILSSATTFSISSSESALSILSASSQSLTSSISSASSPASLSINIPSISSPVNTISNCNNIISSPTSCASASDILASFNSASANQHTDICLLSNTSLTPQSSPASTTSSLISNVTATTTTTITTPSSSSSVSSCNSYRNNNRLFPVSTYVENEQIQNNANSGPNQQQQSQNQQHHHHSQQAILNQSQIKHLSTLKSNNYWQSVADRVNSYEKQSYLPNTSNTVTSAHQHHYHGLPSTPESTIINNCSVANSNQLYQHQNHTQMSPTSMSPSPQSGSTTPTLAQQQKFTYIDPNKTHRVPNPQLKAFQKNAVQSYFERQQLNSSRESFKNYLPSGNLLRPHSLQPQNSPKEIIASHVRNSLPNTFVIANIASQTQQQHHHSLNNQIMQRSMSNHSTSTVISQNQQPQAQQPQNNQRLISQQLNSIEHGFSSNIEFTNGNNVPPPPPPRSRPYMPIRRSSSASDYGDFRENYLHSKENHIPTTTAVKTLTNPEKSSFNDCGVPPPPPPRGKASMLIRRTSSASEYAAARDKHIKTNQTISKDTLGPMIMGPIISVDDWVPERPPKNPQLRIPSPDLPPPPVVIVETDSNLSNQDEPLPPPPPEILRHLRQSSNDETKSSSRRNSFAGSCNGKKPYKPTSLPNDTTAAVLNDTSSSVSKKQQSISMGATPANAEIVRSRPSSSLSQQQMLISSTHKVILNGKLEHSQPLNQQTILNYNYPTSQQTALLDMNGGISALQKNIDVRMSLRKRPHPAPSVPLKPIDINYLDDKNSHSRSQTSGNSVKSPPPLKPRMPIGGNDIQSPGNNSKLRVNSKASYLPRQTRDKFNSADPDHGSYKLTLTSNEDSIISQHSTITPIKHISYPDDILPPKPKCNNNNLPDVLPVGVKLQPSSPTSNGSSPKYGCNINNNNNNNNNSPTTLVPTQSGTLLYPPGYPCNMKIIMPQCNSTSQNNYNQSVQQQQRLNRSPSITPSTPPPPYSSMITLNQRSNQNGSYNSPTQLSDQSSPKFMSQSTIDLKKTQFLDIKENNKFCDGILSPAQSENNISHQQQNITTQSNINESINLSSFSSTKQREFQRTDVIRKLSLEEHHDPGEGRIVRAELVNTTLSVSPPISKSEEKISIKRESLRENIEKITQLQTKLMSAHTLDNSNGDRKILGFSTKSLKLEATQTIKNLESPKDSVKLLENIQSSVPESPIKVASPAQFTSSSPNFINNTSTSSEIKQKALPNIENSSTQSTNVLQRTEIILRVNPPTTETASQTDESLQTSNQDKQLTSISDSNPNSLSYTKLSDRISTPSPTLMPRRKLSEEIDCDILSQKLASLLPSNEDKLSQILAPTVYKSTADYIVNLYNPNVTPRPTKRDVATSTPGEKFFNTEITTSDKSSVADCNGQDNNFTKLNGSINGETSLCDLTKKKEELINRLTKKLDVLTKEQISVKDDTNKNDQLGINLSTKISDIVRPVDVTKFKAYIDDVGHITMLLLSLSGRLAKIENTLHGISESSTEKKILESKRDRLTEQLDEAKKLKEDIDRRGLIVYKIIEKNLTNDDCADYEYFINMKAKLIIDSREIDDKMKLGEEQLIALKETLQIQSEC